MARLINKKLKASTLIEALVAMVIITIIFSIAIKIFGNITQSSVSNKRLNIQFQLDHLAKNSSQLLFRPDELQVEGVRYKISLKKSRYERLNELHILAFDGLKIVDSIKTLVEINEDKSLYTH